MALLSSADAIAALTAAGVNAYKSPARANGRCQTLCYVVGGQPVNLGRLRQLAREVMAPAAAEPTAPAAPVPAQPWDPGTPAASERVALQGERVAILWPIAQALRGAGVALPISWATDGPVMAGELTLQAALSRLPLGAIAQAASALAALPPVTAAQDAALTLCDTGAVPGRPKL